ncbi:hypothetical protein TorRG33x02_246850, partial [Trema orientale]
IHSASKGEFAMSLLNVSNRTLPSASPKTWL